MASAYKRSFKITSNTTPTAVADFPVDQAINNISIANNTDGDIEVYFQATNINIICPVDGALAFDGFSAKGQLYVSNITGTGGSVIITVWTSEGH